MKRARSSAYTRSWTPLPKGVRAHLLRWLSEFLTNPSAQVSFQGHVSTPHPYNLGTPPKKGSCLSPFLFNILMEELTTETYGSGVQLLVYADDRALFIPRRKHQFVASRALEVLKQRRTINTSALLSTGNSSPDLSCSAPLSAPPLLLGHVRLLLYLSYCAT
ncbi:hypothetical protein O3P69_019081 [Scylla paramamosain]|uniref:Reverse transcriptase domain-containing protein n=1 Tax=Scylla paramamosain TaxID=85552 RepID=A0AAW0T7V4_SCYPA